MNLPCERCKQARATVHITDTMPQKTERHLCERCAEKEGIIAKHHQHQHQSTNAILYDLLKQKAGVSGTEGPTCPHCELTFREFQASGQLGCPQDYDVFREQLAPLIERAHEDATHHVGKVPGQAKASVRPEAGLLRLRRELKEAIDAENYERAARLRDEIKVREVQDEGDEL